MERYSMCQLTGGRWCVWQSRNPGVNVFLPTREEAEALIRALKSRADTEFDLPSFLLDEIYPQMDENECAGWNIVDAMLLAQDLLRDGFDADAQEIYEILAEFIQQDAEEPGNHNEECETDNF